MIHIQGIVLLLSGRSVAAELVRSPVRISFYFRTGWSTNDVLLSATGLSLIETDVSEAELMVFQVNAD